jgi:hypothetical protein
MRNLARTLFVAVVLVGVPIAALVVAGTEHQTPLPVTAATRHHFFMVGERECEQTLKKAEAQQGDGQLLGFGVAIDPSPYPKDFRQAVSAGCRAALG